MQFSVVGWGKYTDGEGNDVWGNTPIVSTLLSVSGAAWTSVGQDSGSKPISEYIGNLAFSSQLGLERDETVVAVEPEAAPAEPAAK